MTMTNQRVRVLISLQPTEGDFMLTSLVSLDYSLGARTLISSKFVCMILVDREEGRRSDVPRNEGESIL